jgi:hypothetical protein
MRVYTLKYLKLWENFEENSVTQELIVKCIKEGGTIFAYPVPNLKDNNDGNPKGLKPIDFDVESRKITVVSDNEEYEVDLSKVKKVNIP